VIDSVVPLEYKRLGGAPLRKPKGVAVTRREVVRRINRSLKQDDPFHLLRRARGARAQLDRGDYYVVDALTDLLSRMTLSICCDEPVARVLSLIVGTTMWSISSATLSCIVTLRSKLRRANAEFLPTSNT